MTDFLLGLFCPILLACFALWATYETIFTHLVRHL